MFYTKTKIGEDSEIKTVITDENVYGVCPICGDEVQVDLVEILQEESSDLFGTAVYCDICAADWLKHHPHGGDSK